MTEAKVVSNKVAVGERHTGMTSDERLAEIAQIIERVDQRCMAADGPVTPTLREMTQAEISRIYALAKAKGQP